MTAPKTLLDLAGIAPAPIAPEDTAVVMIDCQNEYVDGILALPGVRPALDQGALALQILRERGLPVFHIQHRGGPGGPFDRDAAVFDIADPVKPVADEPSIEKSLPNALAGTDLHDRLQAADRKHLVLAGFMTHMCVSSTARAALDLGYRCTIVAGACATRDLPDGRGGVVSADDLHRMELAALSDRFATILPDASAL